MWEKRIAKEKERIARRPTIKNDATDDQVLAVSLFEHDRGDHFLAVSILEHDYDDHFLAVSLLEHDRDDHFLAVSFF